MSLGLLLGKRGASQWTIRVLDLGMECYGEW